MTAKITLTWDNGSSEHVDQIVYRSIETFTVDNLPPILARVGRSAREYIDTDIMTGNVYFYAVASENAVGDILLSSVISVTAEVSTGDPNWDKVVALLHFDGNLADEKGLVSWSAQHTTYTAGVFNDCIEFIRSANRSKLFATHTALKLGLSDFTIEFFAKVDTALDSALFDMRPAPGTYNEILIESDKGNIYLWMGGSYAIGPYSAAIPNNSFVHIALVREAGIFRLFVAGVMLGSTTKTANLSSESVQIGASVNVGSNTSSYDLTGSIDELRITKGVARYTENFTPPTEPFPNF